MADEIAMQSVTPPFHCPLFVLGLGVFVLDVWCFCLGCLVFLSWVFGVSVWGFDMPSSLLPPERQRQVELERQRQVELERQRQVELERQRQVELERQRQVEMERQRKLEVSVTCVCLHVSLFGVFVFGDWCFCLGCLVCLPGFFFICFSSLSSGCKSQ